MAHEISTQSFTLSATTPVVVFEGTGKVLIKTVGVAPCWFGDSTIDQTGAGNASTSFADLVGGAIAEFVCPTKIYACRKAGEDAPTIKVRNWF